MPFCCFVFYFCIFLLILWNLLWKVRKGGSHICDDLETCNYYWSVHCESTWINVAVHIYGCYFQGKFSIAPILYMITLERYFETTVSLNMQAMSSKKKKSGKTSWHKHNCDDEDGNSSSLAVLFFDKSWHFNTNRNSALYYYHLLVMLYLTEINFAFGFHRDNMTTNWEVLEQALPWRVLSPGI